MRGVDDRDAPPIVWWTMLVRHLKIHFTPRLTNYFCSFSSLFFASLITSHLAAIHTVNSFDNQNRHLDNYAKSNSAWRKSAGTPISLPSQQTWVDKSLAFFETIRRLCMNTTMMRIWHAPFERQVCSTHVQAYSCLDSIACLIFCPRCTGQYQLAQACW